MGATDPDLKILQGRRRGDRHKAARRLAHRMAITYEMANVEWMAKWLRGRDYDGSEGVKGLRDEFWAVTRVARMQRRIKEIDRLVVGLMKERKKLKEKLAKEGGNGAKRDC